MLRPLHSLMLPVLLLIVLLTLIGGCGGSASSREVVTLPERGEDTGSITLVFSSRAPDLVVAINGKLVVEKVSLRRLHIRRVASGYADIAVACQGTDRTLRVWVESGGDTTVPIAGPPSPPAQNPLLTAGLSVLAFLISRAASDALF